MGSVTLYLIAFGLSMDAFAVSISNGICYKNVGFNEAVYTAFVFSLFQIGMPLLGFYAGRTANTVVESLDHWIALGLLSFIGGSMIYGAFKRTSNTGKENCKTVPSLKGLTIQGIATSIDAFAVGISFAVIKTNIAIAVSLIGIFTFIFCFFGVLIGEYFGSRFKEKAEIFGGIILILIGVKIYIEHTIIH